MVVQRLRTLVLFGVILLFCYTWKFFLPRIPKSVVYGEEMIIPQDVWEQVKKNNEILHDKEIEVERERVATTSSTTSSVEEVMTSTTPKVAVATDSQTVSTPSPTPTNTPHEVAESSKFQAAQNEASESRQHFPSEQTQAPKADSNEHNSTPSQEVQQQQEFNPMIKDNFPLAMNARSAADLPPIPPWNKPPTPHVKEKTPLFIAFTRNWPLLQQTVVSWITSGWPTEDIYVVENTGTMRSNEFGRLSLQNPFFLNHTRLHMLGVNVIVTPTLYTFAQLQNFFLWTAIEKDLETYFWSHMDIVPITFEEDTSASDNYSGHKTIYQHAVEVLKSAQSPGPDPNSSDRSKPWAMRFFAFDYLTLVNRAAFESIGGFDTTIPFYHTDCDMYDRLIMAGYEMNEPRHLMTTVGNDFDGLDRAGRGYIYDVANSIDDLIVLYRKKNTVEASFTDQTRPEDIEAARKHNEEQLKMEKEAQEKEEARRKAEENKKQAVIDDENAQAHTKAMQEQVKAQAMREQATLDNKAEEIKKQEEEKAQNEGHIMDHPKTNADDSEEYEIGNAEVKGSLDRQQKLRQEKEEGEKESSSSTTHSNVGEYRKRDLEDSSANPQIKSLADLHHDATSKSASTSPTASTTSSPSTSLNSKWITDEPGSSAYFQLLQVVNDMVGAKYSQGGDGRNTWQHQQSGGQGEPYYRNADGFEKAVQMTITLGRGVYLEKWGTLECGLIKSGVTMDDEWKPREWNMQ
ncbi:hypothetical protein BELL_0112g00090 [Botrytis elliptica]|uniref:Glycosyl transferase family 8 protein n=1 Tax=Botrytis elliptica TaxID=278938 RepID=A0A4Z1JU10_9HELO|nr:hypothetical protein BELL_0112g00090 [Botrytis elliptica]